MEKGVSVMIPVYNEEEVIYENTEKLINFLEKTFQNFEILICSNGSNDNTVRIGKELERKYNNRVRFFSIPQRGVGSAFKKNVSEAKYKKLVSVDMDLSIDLESIKQSVLLLNDYDLVVGSKKLGKQKRSVIRILISRIFIRLTRILLGIKYTDYSLSGKAFKKSIVEKYINRISHSSFYVVEIIYSAQNERHKIKEISIVCRDNRISKFNIFSEIFYQFCNLMRLTIQRKLEKK